MDEVKLNTSKTLTLTLPSDPTSNLVNVSLYHELGSLVSGPTAATRSSAGVYTITYGQQGSGIYVLNSAGRHRADFTYTISGTSYTQSQYINVYTPYITSAEFFANHAELSSTFTASFDKYERRARNIINTYCGQSFDYLPNKYLVLDGTGNETLHLPVPITTINKVTVNIGDDDEQIIHDAADATLNNIEKVRQPFNFDTTYFIRYRNRSTERDYDRYPYRDGGAFPKRKFNPKSDYKIEGDFGWRFVPTEVEQAADLIIADLMNDDSEYRRHGIYNVDMDAVSFSMKSSFYESTGNIEADVLLMDYTMFVMDYVV